MLITLHIIHQCRKFSDKTRYSSSEFFYHDSNRVGFWKIRRNWFDQEKLKPPNLLTNIFTKNMNNRNIFIVLYIQSQTTFSSGSVWLKARLFRPELNSHPLGTDFSDGEPFPLFTLPVQECEVKHNLTLFSNNVIKFNVPYMLS